MSMNMDKIGLRTYLQTQISQKVFFFFLTFYWRWGLHFAGLEGGHTHLSICIFFISLFSSTLITESGSTE